MFPLFRPRLPLQIRLFKHPINALNFHRYQSTKQSVKPLPPILFLIGGPGAGKGTQSQLLIDEFGAKVRGPSDGTHVDPHSKQQCSALKADNAAKQWGLIHLSIGALLRREMTSSSTDVSTTNPAIKRAIADAIHSGVILPGEITVVLIEQEIQRLTEQQRILNEANKQSIRPCFLIDGFPRSRDNVQEFESNLGPMHSMLCLKVDDSILRARLSKRSFGPANAQSNNQSNNPVKRSDDDHAIVEKRIKTYHTVTEPVIHMWQQESQSGQQSVKQYFEVDGEPDIVSVYKTVRQVYLDWILNHPQNKSG